MTRLLERLWLRLAPEFDLDAPCTSVSIIYSGGGRNTRGTCERDVGHPGMHWCVVPVQGPDGPWERIEVWSRTGGVGRSLATGMYLCDVCGTPEEIGRPCSYCAGWEAVIVEHRADTKDCIVVGGYVYKWTGARGAFAGRAVIVRMNNGDVYGPNSCLWYRSEVPWEYRDRISDNATLEWTGESMPASWQVQRRGSSASGEQA